MDHQTKSGAGGLSSAALTKDQIEEIAAAEAYEVEGDGDSITYKFGRGTILCFADAIERKLAAPSAHVGAVPAISNELLWDAYLAMIQRVEFFGKDEALKAGQEVIGRANQEQGGSSAISHSGEGAAQAGQVAVPEGWKLVPEKPTDSMRYAYARDSAWGRIDIQGYKAMLSAAPSPASESLRSPQEAAGTEKGESK